MATTGLQDVNLAVRTSVLSLIGQGGETWERVRLVESTQTQETQAGSGDVAIVLELAPDLPRVPGSALELQALCTWLVANAVKALAPHPDKRGCITIQSSAISGKLTLSVRDTGPHVPESQMPWLFEPCASVRGGTNGLELAACHNLAVKRFRGAVRGENQVPSGFAIIVELPVP